MNEQIESLVPTMSRIEEHTEENPRHSSKSLSRAVTAVSSKRKQKKKRVRSLSIKKEDSERFEMTDQSSAIVKL
jgi:hypothetical protein